MAQSKQEQSEKSSRLRVHNVVIVYDVYVVGYDDPEAAREAVKQLIVDPDEEMRLKPDDENALPITHTRSIRDSWHNKSPVVTSAVSDEDFERIQGKKTLEIFNLINESPKSK